MINNDDKRNSFVFYASFKEAAQYLDVNEKVEIYEAIINYGLDGSNPNFSKGYLNAIWIGIKIDIDGATKKWNASVNNGKKGGRPKKVEEPSITKTPTIVDEPTAPVVEPTPSSIDELNSMDDDDCNGDNATSWLDGEEEDLTPTEAPEDEYGNVTFKLGNGVIVQVKEKHLDYWSSIQHKNGLLKSIGNNNTTQHQFDYDIENRMLLVC